MEEEASFVHSVGCAQKIQSLNKLEIFIIMLTTCISTGFKDMGINYASSVFVQCVVFVVCMYIESNKPHSTESCVKLDFCSFFIRCYSARELYDWNSNE